MNGSNENTMADGISADAGLGEEVKFAEGSQSQRNIGATLPVSERSPGLYIGLLAGGITTGVAANLLLGGAPGIGLNLFLVFLTFFTSWFLLSRYKAVPAWRKACAIAALIHFAALGFRASEILFSVNLLLAIGFTALACTACYLHVMRSISATIIDLFQVGFNLTFGSVMVMFEAPWHRFQVQNFRSGTVLRILAGIVLSLPFLIIFGFLFSRAELRFGYIFDTVLTLITTTMFRNFWLTFWAALFAMGLLRAAFLSVSVFGEKSSFIRPNSILGFVETVTVLSLLNVMFFAFVMTQLPYFFGGQDRVTNTPNLAWSEYARSGFFELAWVIVLLVPTLILFITCTQTATAKQLAWVRCLCGGLTLLAGVVIMSALQRMLLYTHTFGLTELRVYVSTFIVMLAVILIVLNVLNFTGRIRYFLPAFLATGFLFSIGIQLVNVQGMVAEDIIFKHLSGKMSDMELLEQLSADAVPAIRASGLAEARKGGLIEKIMEGAMKGHVGPSLIYQPFGVIMVKE